MTHILPSTVPRNQPIVDDKGIPLSTFFSWCFNVATLEPIMGEGDPDGVIESQVPRLYIDTVANVLYMKTLSNIGGDRTLGWVPSTGADLGAQIMARVVLGI